MPNGQAHPYVASASISGDQITFSVEVTEFGPVGGSVEISGQATQASGAFANIYGIRPIPTAPNGEDDDKGRYFVDVTATAIPPNRFRKSEDVIVYVKVSRPWVTVLGKGSQGPIVGPDPGDVADGIKWGEARAETHVDGSTFAKPAVPAKTVPLDRSRPPTN
jgi:hypothetical protein